MEKKYDDELKGAFFPEGQSEVVFRGNMQINGEKRYGVIVKSQNRDGKEKHELMFSAGLIHVNTPESKIHDRVPDIGGRVYFDKEKYKFGCWNQRADSGLEYLSAGLSLDEETAPF
tara:strand:+ start:9659 stop:10006 length:348 start_codon:yes stop_codon:yes gene_type:complete